MKTYWPNAFDVRHYGADPTGRVDSWQAFRDWSAAITKQGGGTGVVAAGNYLIDKVANNLSNDPFPDAFVFDHCAGLHLIGYGAKLTMKSDVDVHLVGPDGSDVGMVMPFVVLFSNNVLIEGFEVDGNVNKARWEPGVLQPGGNCVSVVSSNHVTARNMHLHHAWADGISVRAANSAFPAADRLACRNVVTENCDIHSNGRCNVAIHEMRHVRISDSRIHDAPMGIDIEPDLSIGDEFDTNIRPRGSSRFTTIENCEIFANEKPLTVNVRNTHVRVQACFIDNQFDSQQPVVLSVPHCTLLDSEIDAGAGRIDVALTGTIGRNVFTMERCLIRSHTAMVNGVRTTGAGLFVAVVSDGEPPQPRLAQAMVANNRFINESTEPWFNFVDGTFQDNGTRFPNLSHDHEMLQLTFRDNYIFIPKAAYGSRDASMAAVSVTAHLCENNLYETDLVGDDQAGDGQYFEALYDPSNAGVPPKFGVLVRNERFVSAGDGTGFRPGDHTLHDNTFPYSHSLIGHGSIELGLDGKRVFFSAKMPTVGSFERGDIVFNVDPAIGQPIGWVCVTATDVGIAAIFAPMQNL